MFTEQNGDLLHAEADLSAHHPFAADSQGGQVFGDFFHAYVEQIVRNVLESQRVALPQAHSMTKRASRPKEKKPRVTPSDLGLTRREVEVLRILAQGKSNKEICRELNIAQGTVKIHARNLCAKLNVARRTEAIAAVNRMGLALEAN